MESLAFLGLDPPVVVAVSFLLTFFHVEPLDGSVGRAYPATWVTKPPTKVLTGSYKFVQDMTGQKVKSLPSGRECGLMRRRGAAMKMHHGPKLHSGPTLAPAASHMRIEGS